MLNIVDNVEHIYLYERACVCERELSIHCFQHNTVLICRQFIQEMKWCRWWRREEKNNAGINNQ